jgi:molybdopterin synthase catalytic subunit
VLEDIAAEFPAVHLAATHRVGELTIGDLAVVVAAGAAHRADAFQAASALIDRIKAEVPIWKHQRFADGTEEWVGSLSSTAE